MPLAPANDRGRDRLLIVGADDARRAGRAAVLRAGRRPGYRQGHGRCDHPGAQRHHGGGRQQESRTFGTTRRELESLADWLACWGVSRAGMEATGDYWKPVFFLLESRGFDCQLYNAGQVKALPGRPKTDRADSIWIARITERGTVASSFVPPEPIRALRTHTRYRRHLTQARTAEKQRVEKLLEDGHLKLSR